MQELQKYQFAKKKLIQRVQNDGGTNLERRGEVQEKQYRVYVIYMQITGLNGQPNDRY